MTCPLVACYCLYILVFLLVLLRTPSTVDHHYHLLFNRFFQLPLNALKYLVNPLGSAGSWWRYEPRAHEEEDRAARLPSDRLRNMVDDANGRSPLRAEQSSAYSVPANTISLSSNRLSKLSYVVSIAVSFLPFRRTDGNFRMNPKVVDLRSSETDRSNATLLPGGSGGWAHRPQFGEPDIAGAPRTTDVWTEDRTRCRSKPFKRCAAAPHPLQGLVDCTIRVHVHYIYIILNNIYTVEIRTVSSSYIIQKGY